MWIRSTLSTCFVLLVFLVSNAVAAAVTVSVPSTSSTGRFEVRVSGGYSWTLYERKSGGTWRSLGSGYADAPFSVTVTASGTYSYRVYNCFPMAGGCAYSTSRSIVVQIPPPIPNPPSISGPSSANSGSFTISWAAVSGTTFYQTEEKLNSGNWTVAQQSSENKIKRTNQSDGVWHYRVSSCVTVNTGGNYQCSSNYSNIVSVSVDSTKLPPAPTLEGPKLDYDGDFTISWSEVDNTLFYILEESFNGGAFQARQVLDEEKTLEGKADGIWYFRVSACVPEYNADGSSNSSSCSKVSDILSVEVDKTGPPATYRYVYNPLGRLVKVYEYDSLLNAYCYDSAGNRTVVTQDTESADCDEPVPPSTPTGLSYGSAAPNAYTAHWNELENATYYIIKYTTNLGDVTKTLQGKSNTSFACNEDPYSRPPIYVKACNIAGCSDRAYF